MFLLGLNVVVLSLVVNIHTIYRKGTSCSNYYFRKRNILYIIKVMKT